MKQLRHNPLARQIASAGMLGMAGGLAFSLLSRAVRSGLPALLWRSDPAFAARTARAMLGYTLPAGFHEQKALVINETRTVLIAPEHHADALRIVLIQEPKSLRNQAWRDTIEAGWTRSIAGRRYTTRLVSTREEPVGGALVALNTREGTDAAGRPVRQLTAVVPGKQGEVILVIVGPLEHWDQAVVDRFVRSIHPSEKPEAHDGYATALDETNGRIQH
ncbi:MAG TPA: hypothetical protein VFS21_16190 [Roseiflexaceae bacterium]|nr:hypothetical protein [Roseiflexaceae bacterium]